MAFFRFRNGKLTFTCYDGSVNEPDCKLDTKPQPQWADNWLSNDNRRRFMITGQELLI